MAETIGKSFSSVQASEICECGHTVVHANLHGVDEGSDKSNELRARIGVCDCGNMFLREWFERVK